MRWHNFSSIKCPYFLSLAVPSMDRSRNKMSLQQVSAVPCSVRSQMAQKCLMMRLNRHERKKKNMVSDFCFYLAPTQWVESHGHSTGALLSPTPSCSPVAWSRLVSRRWALLCVPFLQWKGQFSLPGPANPSSDEIAKAKAISVPVPAVLWVFLIIYSSCGDCSCWNFIAWVL